MSYLVLLIFKTSFNGCPPLGEIKNLVMRTLELVQHTFYKDGIVAIESAHEAFFAKGDVKLKMKAFKRHVFELDKDYRKSMNPDRLCEFLEDLFEQENGWKKVLDMLDYILVVEGKYLQMMSIYHSYHKNGQALEGLYETFNQHYEAHSNTIAKFLKKKVPTFHDSIFVENQKIKVKMERLSWLSKLIVSGDPTSEITLERLFKIQFLTEEMIFNAIDAGAVITEQRRFKGGRKWENNTPLEFSMLTASGLKKTYLFNLINDPSVLRSKVPYFEDTILWDGTSWDGTSKETAVIMKNFSLLSKLVVADDEESLTALQTLYRQKILTTQMLNTRDSGLKIIDKNKNDRKWSNCKPFELATYKRNESIMRFLLQTGCTIQQLLEVADQ